MPNLLVEKIGIWDQIYLNTKNIAALLIDYKVIKQGDGFHLAIYFYEVAVYFLLCTVLLLNCSHC